MPKKIRELKQNLSKAGFVLQKGRGKEVIVIGYIPPRLLSILRVGASLPLAQHMYVTNSPIIPNPSRIYNPQTQIVEHI